MIELASRRRVVAYPDLRAAAGHVQAAAAPPDDELVWLPLEGEASRELFAVRVSGTSMDGGKEPLRDGDWAVMRVARSLPASAVENRVVLVETESDSFGAQYQIKRLVKRGAGWLLASDNPAGPTIEATSAMVPIARLERAIRPESLAPAVGTVIEEHALAARFGLPEVAPRSDRQSGHLFIVVDRKGMLEAPDRLRFAGVTPRAAETAFVLIAQGGSWRYTRGRLADRRARRVVAARGRLHELAHLGRRTRGLAAPSRRGAGARAARRGGAAGAAHAERWLERGDGGRARIVGAAPRGGIRIDGGDGGFAERTVSLQDLAWVSVANADVGEHGGVLDEARVNRLRYLEGTPKESTRWIDTGWAIAAWRLAGDSTRTR